MGARLLSTGLVPGSSPWKPPLTATWNLPNKRQALKRIDVKWRTNLRRGSNRQPRFSRR